MSPEIKTLCFLHQEMGINLKILGKYCNCHSTTLGKYINKTCEPTEKAKNLIKIGLTMYLNKLNEGVEI